MHINNQEIHNTNRTRDQCVGSVSLVHSIQCLAAPLLLIIGVAISGCSSTAVPTRQSIVEASATTQVKPSATATPRPSPISSSTIRPTVKPSASPTQPAPTPEPVYYIVEAGDYVETIAKMFGITVDELVTVNGLTLDGVLSIGQKLLIPIRPEPTVAPDNTPQGNTPTATPELVYVTITHVVQKGETIDTIAAQYGITWKEIAEANGIGKDSILSIGQELTIPKVAVAPEATSEPAATRSSTPEPAQTVEPATPAPAQVTYIVSKGDYIESIAERFGITADQLAEANGISINTVLQVGQELEIPNQAATTEPTRTPEAAQTVEPATPAPVKIAYIVSQGDYLELIAERFGITADQLAEANGITINTVLQVGKELEIPNQQATAEPTRTPTVTPTPTPTAVKRNLPTARPTSTDAKSFPYQQPLPLAPVNNTVFEGADTSILLNWISVGILASNEWYQVRIWKDDVQDVPLIFYSKATSWRPPLGFYSSDNAPYTIRWQVVVVGSVMADSTFDIKSPVSAIYSFYWR